MDFRVIQQLRDPLKFLKFLWPRSEFYDLQREMVLSVRDNRETYVVAANKVGKDYTAGALTLGAFLNPRAFLLRPDESPPVPSIGSRCNIKISTTSVKDRHLDDLWGEIDRFVRTSRFPLRVEEGGPLVVLQREIRRVVDGEIDRGSYLKAEVTERGEGMAGHHADYTLIVGDEASALEDQVYVASQGWAKRMLWFGNPHDCQNFWRRGIELGEAA